MSLLQPLRYMTFLKAAKHFVFRPAFTNSVYASSSGAEAPNTIFFNFHAHKNRRDFDESIYLVFKSIKQPKVQLDAVYKFDCFAFLFFSLLAPGFILRRDKFLAFFAQRRVDYLCSVLSCFGKPRNIFTFCDAIVDDFYVASIFKSQGVKTFTLQHGLYQFLESQSRPENIAFEAFVSDVMLVWGESTIVESRKLNIPSDRFVVTGRFDGFDPVIFRRVENSICFYMNSPVNRHFNQLVLDVLDSLKRVSHQQIFIKMHPNDKRSNYERVNFPLLTDGDFCDYSIIISSGVVTDLVRLDTNTFLFDCELALQSCRLCLPCFSNVDELQILLKGGAETFVNPGYIVSTRQVDINQYLEA